MKKIKHIPFNKLFLTGKELENISETMLAGNISSDGLYTKKCSSWLEEHSGAEKALLTPSCTAALEMAAILSNIKNGDEVIIPNYTFTSTANAIVLRGGIPVFVDIREDTLNIDERLIEEKITTKTKAIIVVHYAGVSCNMDFIINIAKKYKLIVIEDAAQAINSKYKNKILGSIGDIGCYSFHYTKNIVCGEGGALLINNSIFIDRSEIIRQKGTNYNKFINGLIDKYTWVDMGSSYLPTEISSAFLAAQLKSIDFIQNSRMEIWNFYHENLLSLESKGYLRRPVIPSDCDHNAHMYYILLKSASERTRFINTMKSHGIICNFHYLPLSSSPMMSDVLTSKHFPITSNLSDRLVRLPIWVGLKPELPYKISKIFDFFK
jgi:dTDP-4-amino-4,6-dideoxygalactose transaminase